MNRYSVEKIFSGHFVTNVFDCFNNCEIMCFNELFIVEVESE